MLFCGCVCRGSAGSNTCAEWTGHWLSAGGHNPGSQVGHRADGVWCGSDGLQRGLS